MCVCCNVMDWEYSSCCCAPAPSPIAPFPRGAPFLGAVFDGMYIIELSLRLGYREGESASFACRGIGKEPTFPTHPWNRHL